MENKYPMEKDHYIVYNENILRQYFFKRNEDST